MKRPKVVKTYEIQPFGKGYQVRVEYSNIRATGNFPVWFDAGEPCKTREEAEDKLRIFTTPQPKPTDENETERG